ncbi:hypothetical protein [Zophobihabitans entericus]|uniref:Lipoprotein n=1 Tax=Zophobihabitans entericus TaxID=1635327 RepID=A0A6G9IBL1_9GAMM|nr:hypothetical protein [Zophobihabitans entericus]QIQ21603.1 hypothetical protein IPMB12_07850 [Zophobihabitans entericus]
MKSIKFILIALAAVVLAGCGVSQSYEEDPKAFSTGVTIVTKEQVYAWGSRTKYELKDKDGMSYDVYSDLDIYNVGDCVTLWQSRNRSYWQYPRITPAQSNCQAATKQQDVGDNFVYSTKNGVTAKQIISLHFDAWLGASANEIMSAWGVPDKQSSADGVSYLGYVYNSYDPYGNRSYCDLTFTVKKGVMTNYKWSGNDCGEFLR